MLLVIWLYTPLNNWLIAFVKLSQMRMPYTVMFFTLLFILLCVMSFKVRRKTFMTVVFHGAIFGHIMAFISIFIANFFIPDGLDRTIKTLAREGLMNLLLMDFVVAFILGGWVFGIVGLGILKLIARTESES